MQFGQIVALRRPMIFESKRNYFTDDLSDGFAVQLTWRDL
jgi:hypothetical protein